MLLKKKTLMLGKIEGRRRRGWPRMRWLGGITDSMGMDLVDSGSWWWTGKPGVLHSMGSQRVGHDWATELNWYSPPTPSLLSAEQLAFSGLNLKSLATQTEKEGNRLPLPQQPPKMRSVPVPGTPRTPLFVELLLKWLNIFVTNAFLSLVKGYLPSVFPHLPRFSFNTVIQFSCVLLHHVLWLMKLVWRLECW